MGNVTLGKIELVGASRMLMVTRRPKSVVEVRASLDPVGDEELAERVSYAWAGLSRACHQHPYELPPTSSELLGWLGTVEQFVTDVRTIADEGSGFV